MNYDAQMSKRRRRHEIQLVSNTRLAWLASTFYRKLTNPNVGRLALWKNIEPTNSYRVSRTECTYDII